MRNPGAEDGQIKRRQAEDALLEDVDTSNLTAERIIKFNDIMEACDAAERNIRDD